MTRHTRATDWLFAVLLILLAPAALRAAFPAQQKYVADFAGVLDPATAERLQERLRAVERETTAEIAVVTVASLDGMTVEDYANGLFKDWGIGKKGLDNGLLVLVCPNEKKMRIEVGYGLEPILPDALASSIIRSDFTPRFQDGDFAGGITRGTDRLIAVVREKHVVTAEEKRRLDEADRPPSYLMTPFFGLFIAIGAFAVGAGIRARAGFPLIFGGMFGGIPLVMALVPFFNASLWILAIVGIAMLAWGLVKGGSPSFAASLRGTSPRSRGSRGSRGSSGWVMGGGSSGSSWSGGSSSGGSSFGGGSSGGGGASGSW